MIPVFDILLDFYSLVDDVVGLQDCLMVRIWTIDHVNIFKRVFNFVENIVD